MTININDLTIGEAKELAVLFNNTESKQPGLNSMVGVKAIIRTYSAGVWYGEISQKSGKEVIVKNGRRMNYFKVIKGISLSSVANNGVHQDSRIAEAVDSVWLEAVELIPCRPAAITSIEGHASE